MSVDHYENFPVASLLLPARLRQPVGVVYAFARSADDIVDEGDAAPADRIAALDAYVAELECIAAGQRPRTALFVALADVVARHRLPLQPFHDLLSAFRQDVLVSRYADQAAVLDYCRRSADPVGRIMLALYAVPFGDRQDLRLRQSDAICTALQLINFWQDVAIDLAKDRIYLPQADLARHGLSEADLRSWTLGGVSDARWRALLGEQIEHSRALMRFGAPLARALPGRIGLELRMVVQGGLRILEKIEAVDCDVFRRRPVLRPADWLLMAARAAFT